MSEESLVFKRGEERPANLKAFAVDVDDLKGKSLVEQYNKDPLYVQSKEMHKTCMMYGTAYADTILQRIENEQPDYFSNKGVSRTTMMAHLINNICLPVAKAHGRQFRNTTANFNDKAYTTDAIRRLNNNGDKFHPYL
jgi:hypothetical protein